VKRRVKRISYNRSLECKIIFSEFRKTFLSKYYPSDKNAEVLFRKDLSRLAANYSSLFFLQYSLFSELWFHKHIYNAIILKGEDAYVEELVRNASLNGAILYLPNHQAHIDSLVISWIANKLLIPQPLFFAWNTLARRRSSYLMPLVNVSLLNRGILDKRYPNPDPFKQTREYHVGYTILIDRYLEKMLSLGIDTLIYPEGGRTYSGAIGEARIKRIYKNVRNVQQSPGFQKTISVVPISITYALVPEAELLIDSFNNKTIAPPSSLFHDIQNGDDIYKSFRPVYITKTDFPFVVAFKEKKAPIFCTVCNPISLRDNPDISLQDCFENVKRNLKILPHYFISKLLLGDPTGISQKWQIASTDGLLEPARALRDRLPETHTDPSFYSDDGLADIISIGMEFLRSGEYIFRDGSIRNNKILKYYSNKIPI
jgi:1-acyl-sn-glycerol-3-phosphate acyltransferase